MGVKFPQRLERAVEFTRFRARALLAAAREISFDHRRMRFGIVHGK